MFGADVLTFREFMMGEPLPLATLHNAVLEFLRGRDDVVLFGAQAVNAYVNEPRMTQDLDLLSTHAEGVAQALRDYLRQRFRIAVRIRRVGDGRGFRVFQVRKAGNRHLVDLRRVETLPGAERIAGMLVALGYDPALVPERIQVTTGSGMEFVPRASLHKIVLCPGNTRSINRHKSEVSHESPP